MDKFGLSQKNIEKIFKILKKYPNILEVKIFGSRALGNYKKNSDIDLVLFGDFSTNEFNQISLDLKEVNTPYLIDVLNYQEITHTNLKKHIREKGITFYKK